VIGSDVPSTYHERPAGVAECFQCSEDGVSSPSSEIRAVFKSEPTRSALSDDADGFKVEAASFPFDAFAFCVGAGDVLARGASDDDGWETSGISNNSICCECADIVIDKDIRVVLLIDCAAPRDVFAGRNGFEPGPVHSERPATGRRAEKV
jgi:hypothetical protein